MKIYLQNLLIVFALAVVSRLAAQSYYLPFVERPVTLNLRAFGSPLDFSAPVGAPARDSQGRVYVAFGTGDINASPSLYFGGLDQISGVGPNWNGNGNLTFSMPCILGTSPGDANYASAGVQIADVNNSGISEMCVAGDGGGDNGVGALDIFSITSTAITLQAIISLIASFGTDPSGVTIGPDGSKFLTCQTGGTGNAGAVLKILADTTLLINFLPFTGANGSEPVGELITYPGDEPVRPGAEVQRQGQWA